MVKINANPGPMDDMPGLLEYPTRPDFDSSPAGAYKEDADARLVAIASIIDAARKQYGCRPQDADVILLPAEVDRVYSIATRVPQ